MFARITTAAALLAAALTPAFAAEVTVDGTLYGAVRYDQVEGSITPGENGAPAVIDGDGDHAFNFNYVADVNVRAQFREDLRGTVGFTFDYRKQSPFYRYRLFSGYDAEHNTEFYYLEEDRQNRYVYGSLEEVALEMSQAFWKTDLTLGGYDIRYGHGGYYNGLVNRIDPVSFVAYLDPFGVKLARTTGPLASTLELGAGLQHQLVAATSQTFGGFTAYAAVEGLTYDLVSLWDTHYGPALPKYWAYRFEEDGVLAVEPRASVGPGLYTLHVGVDRTWKKENWDLYAVVAYHSFPDAPAFAQNPTGGSVLQIYPDFGFRILGPRVWLRGALMYERWQANYASAFGDGVSANDYILAFAEPEYFLTDKMFIGLGGRYLNPSGQTPDDPTTPIRENQLFSVAALPHFRYMPVERVFIDVTYEYAQWDPSFDLTPTTLKEDRLQELRLEIEAGF